MTSYHQLGEHSIQLVVSGHRQGRLHGLQGEVLPEPVGDLRVIVAVKTAEDVGQATAVAAAAATFPRSHGCPDASGCSGRERWRLLLGLFTASSTSGSSLRQRALWVGGGEGTL